MPIKVHGLELQALFDTGSDGSVISTRVWEMFPDEERPELRPGDRPIEGPSGNIVEQEGVANLLLDIDGRLIQRIIRVAPIVEDVILGNDILEPFKLNWDYERRRILWPEDTVPLEDSGEPDFFQPEGFESVRDGGICLVRSSLSTVWSLANCRTWRSCPMFLEGWMICFLRNLGSW